MKLSARRSVRPLAVWIAICAAGGGCAPRFGLLPRIQTQSSRDPDPTRPLVETPTAPPRAESGHRTPRSPAMIGKADAAVSAASALTWLLGGAAPVLGVHGTFDETRLFGRKPAGAARAGDRGAGSRDPDASSGDREAGSADRAGAGSASPPR